MAVLTLNAHCHPPDVGDPSKRFWRPCSPWGCHSGKQWGSGVGIVGRLIPRNKGPLYTTLDKWLWSQEKGRCISIFYFLGDSYLVLSCTKGTRAVKVEWGQTERAQPAHSAAQHDGYRSPLRCLEMEDAVRLKSQEMGLRSWEGLSTFRGWIPARGGLKFGGNCTSCY